MMIIDKNKLKVLKKINKYVLIGSLVGFVLTTPLSNITAKAMEEPNTGYFELSDDNIYLYCNGLNNLSFVDDYKDLTEIMLQNSVVDNNLDIDDSMISIIDFDNCNFKSNDFKLPSTLNEVYFEGALPKDFNSFNNLENLEKITFNNCEFNDLNQLSNLDNLSEITFNSCNIGSIKGIEKLTKLNALTFNQTKIERIDQLKELKNLETLVLDCTSVKDLSPIINSNITYLDVSNSPNIDLSAIMEMKNLTYIKSNNCEMSYTDELLEYASKNIANSDITQEGLDIKKQVLSIKEKIINNQMNDNEKIKAIVGYIIDNLEFDYDVLSNPDLSLTYNEDSLEYALKKKGCCKNYTSLVTSLINAAGIDVYEIQNDNHIWNLVKVGNDFYWLDTTWIDEYEWDDFTKSSDYMTTDEEFTLSHTGATIPSSYYNKIHNINVEEANDLNANISDVKEAVKKEFKYKKASIVSMVGILSALGAAIPVNKYRKNKKNNLEKDLNQNNRKIK